MRERSATNIGTGRLRLNRLAVERRATMVAHVEAIGFFEPRIYLGSDATVTDATTPPAFKTRREIELYFRGDTIECLMCGRHFKRLQMHLAAKHGVAADEYKSRFGLPWTRGLTSAASLANSGWTGERKAKARKLARKSSSSSWPI
jgi:predicted transcriptional regulator